MKIRKLGEYYGAKNDVLSIDGIHLSEYQYHDPNTPWHYHENPYFMYVLNGNMTDINKKRTERIPTGSLVFHNWEDQHLNEKHSQKAGGFHLELRRSWFEGKKLDIDLWEGSQVLQDPRHHHLLFKIYAEFKRQDEYSKLNIEILLLQLCEQIDKQHIITTKKKPTWIETLREILHADIEVFSLQQLSDILGVHPVHISRSIPTYFNSNLGEYLRKLKIKKALKNIINPNISLTQVAFDSGFSDQSHFTKTFKLYFGETPKSFRSKLMN